ncbi:MAG TPA: hypothetical protein VHI12_03375 [Gaiellaceae bacterium]|jgi:hypothetical protein|nr:hypothetical protein [Gaiellaceae bacterium]
MKRILIISFLTTAVAALLPAVAFGKGASEATIVGPGLDDPITLAGEDQPGGEALMRIAESAGFFPAVFTQSPDPMLDERPTGTLGPEYTVTYVMPGPNNELDEIVQSFYPYASPSPVSYTKPGQLFWTTERTRGGWYVAFSDLKDSLVAVGLPQNAPTGPAPSDSPWKVVGPVLVLVLVAALGGLAAVLIRRRPQTA